jgi:hypothetical protein
VAVDLFVDADTREAAAAAHRVPDLGRAALTEVLARPDLKGLPLVYGAGFEHDPGLLAEIARTRPLIGNRPETLARLKDPFAFAESLRRLGIPHPAVARRVASPAGWLSKRVGGSGGAHVRPADRVAPPGRYLQARAPGRPLSALFAASGGRALVLGHSEQWHAPTPEAPFRYGGAAGPVPLTADLRRRLDHAVGKLAAEFGLTGLNSADFLVDGADFHLIEVNPRPGATLDLFDDQEAPLLHLHLGGVQAVRTLPARTRAAAVLYAGRRIVVPEALPAWTADRPVPGTAVEAGEPVCTVMAEGPDARGAVTRRLGRLAATLSPDLQEIA